jgi:RNA polymerase sigma-70 factor (ECF subfamily)
VRNSEETSQSESEERLIVLCQAGDRNSFRRLVEQHQQYAFALAFRLVCDEELAKDIVQQSFIRVWRHLDRIDPRKKFTTWLYTIVVNLAYDHLRAGRRITGVFSALPGGDEDPQSEEDLEESVSNRDLAERIRMLTDQLPPTQKIVFVLRDLQDLSVGEVSAMLGMSVSSVKANLSHARRQIRERMHALIT